MHNMKPHLALVILLSSCSPKAAVTHLNNQNRADAAQIASTASDIQANAGSALEVEAAGGDSSGLLGQIMAQGASVESLAGRLVSRSDGVDAKLDRLEDSEPFWVEFLRGLGRNWWWTAVAACVVGVAVVVWRVWPRGMYLGGAPKLLGEGRVDEAVSALRALDTRFDREFKRAKR